jgi:hypothetical protein
MREIIIGIAAFIAICGAIAFFGSNTDCPKMQTGYGERCEGLVPPGFMGPPHD